MDKQYHLGYGDFIIKFDIDFIYTQEKLNVLSKHVRTVKSKSRLNHSILI